MLVSHFKLMPDGRQGDIVTKTLPTPNIDTEFVACLFPGICFSEPSISPHVSVATISPS